MDEPDTIWNVLHDGSITNANLKGDVLTLQVAIPYLRRFFMPAGDGFRVDLLGCTGGVIEFWDDSPPSQDLGRLNDLQPEILSAEAQPDGLIRVCIDGGFITLGYREVRLALDTGPAITLHQLIAAASQYWDEFERRGTERGGA